MQMLGTTMQVQHLSCRESGGWPAGSPGNGAADLVPFFGTQPASACATIAESVG